MNKKIKKTVAFIMSFIMVFLLFNTVFVSTANAEEIPENKVIEMATITDAPKEEISTEASTEAATGEASTEGADISVDVSETEAGAEPETEENIEMLMALMASVVDTNYTFYFTDGGSLNAVCENEHTPVVAHTSGGNQIHCIDASLSSAFQWTNYGWQSGNLTWSYSEAGNSSMADVLFEYYKGDNPNRAVSDSEISGGTSSLYNRLTHDLDAGNGGTRTAPTKEAYKIVNASNVDVSGKAINATVDTVNNIQKTETLTFLTGTSYLHHYVTVPAGITMHYTPYDTGVPATATNTTVALVNGSTAYFTAPLTANVNISISSTCINRDFTTGYYIGNLYILAPQKSLTNSSGSSVALQRFMYCDGLTASGTFSINFVALGSLKIQKFSTNPDMTDGNGCYSLEGAEFTVQNEDKSKTWTLTTKADGTAQLDNIPVGKYTVKEIKAPKGYVINPTPFHVTVTTAHTPPAPYIVEVGETPKGDPVRALVQKQSADGDYEGKYLEDAEFTVKFYEGVQQDTDPALDGMTADRTWVLKTILNEKTNEVYASLDEKHKVSGDAFYFYESEGITVPTLPFGTITIQETKAPTGYLVDDTIYVRTITDDGGALEEVNTYNMPIISEEPNKRPVQFVKLGGNDGKNPLANAGFKVCRTEDLEKDAEGNYIWDESKVVAFAKDNGKELFTDENGNAESCPLFYGKYMMRETTVPNDHVAVKDTFFTVDDNSSEPVVLGSFTDAPLYSWLKIIKADSVTGESILSSNAVFKIWDYQKEEYVSFDNISEFETKNGMLFLPGRLINGTYRLEEIRCPEGYYSKGDTDITITNAEGAVYEMYVDENGDVTDDILTTVTVSNEQLYGVITVDKSAENRKWDEKEGFVSKDIKLSDIEFGIYAAEDIYFMDGHGTLLHKKGDKVCTIVTDKDGHAESEELYLGTYTVVEENTPEEYEPSEPQTVKIAFDDETTDITENGEIKKLIYKNIEVYNAAKVPEIGTTATDSATKSHVGAYSEQARIEDVVHYGNLIPGREYEVSGVLMLKSTGQPLLDENGNQITANKTFTAETESGDVSLVYTFDSRLLAGQTVVVFEDLYLDGEKVATHVDIEDEGQSIHYPKIGTLAVAEDGTKVHIAYGKLDITDTCAYENLVPGYRYRISGILMNRADNEPVLDENSNTVTGSVTFYADESSGTVDVSYSVDVTYMPDYYVVVFEELYFEETGTKIAEHKDIDDDNQMIKMKGRGWIVLHGSGKPGFRGYHTPYTGDGFNVTAVAVIGLLALILAVAMLLIHRRKKGLKTVLLGKMAKMKRLMAFCLSVGLSFSLCNVTAYAEEAKENEDYVVITETKTYDTDDETKFDFDFVEGTSTDGVEYKLDHIEYEAVNVYESVYGKEEIDTELFEEKDGIQNVDRESFKPKDNIFREDMEYVFDSVTFEKAGHTDVDAVLTLDTEVLPTLDLSKYPETMDYEYDGETYQLPYARYEETKGWYASTLTGTIYDYDNGSFTIGETVITNDRIGETETMKAIMRDNGFDADRYRPVSFEYASEPYTSFSGKTCRDYIINYEMYGSVYTLFYEKKLDAPLYKATVKYVLSDECAKQIDDMKNSYEVTAYAYYSKTMISHMSPVTKAVLGAGIAFLIMLFVALVIYILKGGRKPTDYKSNRDIRKDYKELK